MSNKEYPEGVKGIFNIVKKYRFNDAVRARAEFDDARASEGESFGPRSDLTSRRYDHSLGKLAASVGKHDKDSMSTLVTAESRRRRAKSSGTIFVGTK